MHSVRLGRWIGSISSQSDRGRDAKRILFSECHAVGMTFDRITVDPTKMGGQPCIRGMRLTVKRVLEALAAYPNPAELRQQYPELEDEDIRQALAYAATLLPGQHGDLSAAS